MNNFMKHQWFWPAGVLITLAMLTLTQGCGYGEVSPTAYQYAKALYSISNRQAEHQLDAVTQQIQESQQQGELQGSEAAWLQSIIEQAREGQWKEANQAARQIMEDQIR